VRASCARPVPASPVRLRGVSAQPCERFCTALIFTSFGVTSAFLNNVPMHPGLGFSRFRLLLTLPPGFSCGNCLLSSRVLRCVLLRARSSDAPALARPKLRPGTPNRTRVPYLLAFLGSSPKTHPQAPSCPPARRGLERGGAPSGGSRGAKPPPRGARWGL